MCRFSKTAVCLGSFSVFCLFRESKSDSLSIVTPKVLDYLEVYQKLKEFLLAALKPVVFESLI